MILVANPESSVARPSVWSILGQTIAYLIVPLSIIEWRILPGGVQITVIPTYAIAAIGFAAAARGQRMPSMVAAVGYFLAAWYAILFAIELINGDLASYPRPVNFDFLTMYFILLAFPFFVMGLCAVGCEIRRFEMAMAATVIAAVLWSVLQVYVLGWRPAGGIGGLNTNTFGMAVSIWTLFLLSRALEDKIIRVPWMAVSLAGLIPIVLSGSRLVWLHTALGMAALFLWWVLTWRRWLVFWSVAVVGGAVAAAILYSSRFVMERITAFAGDLAATIVTGDMSGTSVGSRYAMAVSGLRAFLERPLFGYGLADVKVAALAHRPENAPDFISQWHLHNQYITHMVAFGVAGLLFTLSILGLFLVAASRSDNLAVRRFGFVAAGVLAIDMMAEMWFHGGTGYGILFLLLGLILLTATEQSPGLNKAAKGTATVGAA